MKKLNYLLLGLAGLTLASCSQDDLFDGGANGNYAITVNLPADMATRAMGDNALAAQQLNYAIYDADGNFIEAKTADFGGATSMTLPLKLPAGASFKIAFFAQSSNSTEVYKFNGANKTFTVDYSNMTSALNNEDDYDCFYNLLETGPIGSTTMQTSVTLYRPVAQINWGTNDISTVVENTFGTQLQNLEATLSTTGYDTFNLLTQEVSNSTDNNTVTIADLTPSTQGFPVPGYNYVAMQYILVSADKEVVDLNLAIDNKSNTAPNTITVSSAPVQANYRTNIYGNLLTDNINFTVDLSADWGGADYNLPQPWDGKTMTKPEKNADGAYEINTPAEWIYLTQKVTDVAGASGRVNSDVVINADLDFGGNEVQGIYMDAVFNGQDHTIKNFTIIPKSSYASGFFGGDIDTADSPLTVQNVTFENVKVTNHNSDKYGWAAVVIGDVQTQPAILKNVNVIDAQLDGIKCVAGLVGFVASNQSLTLENCSVSNSTLTNIPVAGESGFVAGLVGRPVGPISVTGCSVSNTTIDAFYAADRGAASIQAAIGNQPNPSGVTTNEVSVNRTEVTTGASVNGQSYASLQDAIASNPSGATIQLGLGTYSTPTNFGSGDYILKGFGPEFTIVEANNPTWTETGTITASDLTFKSFVNSANHTHMAFTGATNQTFNNVTFNGEFHVTSGSATFTDCTFNYDKASGTNYQLWCQTTGTVTVNNCTMNCNDGKAILVYGLSAGSTGGNIVVDGLTVSSIGNKNDKGVVEIHSERYTGAGTINISNVTYPASYFQNGLWQEIYNVAPYSGQHTDYYKVIVDGKTVQDGGKTGTYKGNGEYSN